MQLNWSYLSTDATEVPNPATTGGFQQLTIAARCSSEVQCFLNEYLPHHWIGCATASDRPFCTWSQGSANLTLCDFFSVGVCEGCWPCATSATKSVRVTMAYCYWHQIHRCEHTGMCMERTRLLPGHMLCDTRFSH